MFLFDNQLITGDNNSRTLLTLKGVITPATERLNGLARGEGNKWGEEEEDSFTLKRNRMKMKDPESRTKERWISLEKV